MSKIAYIPKQKEVVKIGEYTFEIIPPKVKVLPYILELQKKFKQKGLSENSTEKDFTALFDRDTLDLVYSIVYETLLFNYPDTSKVDIDKIINENIMEFVNNITKFMGISDKDLEDAKRKQAIMESGKLKN